MALAPLKLTIRPHVDTMGTLAQVANGISDSGLIRIKDGYIQKLGGCSVIGTTLHGGFANIMLPWAPHDTPPMIAIGASGNLEINVGGTSTDITPTPVGPPSLEFWTLALWGDWLLANPETATLYYWVPDDPVTGQAVAVSTLAGATGVPTAANGVFVAGAQQQAFAWGIYSVTYGEQDPLLIGFCDIANLQDWTASAINQAGSFKLSSGSLIVAGAWFNLVGLFWTDIDLWIAQYIGFPLVYSFQKAGQNCGLIGRRAWAILGPLVAWMGTNDFFVFQGGAVSVIPCSVRNFVFNTLARNGGPNLQVHADSNSYYNEITWRFSQSGAIACNAYVKWSPSEGAGGSWDVWADPIAGPGTTMWLNCWSDSAAFFPPLGVDVAGALLGFEFLDNDVLIDYAGSALDSYFVTGWFYINDGGENVFIERINPDFIFTALPRGTPTGQLQVTINIADEIPSDQSDYPIRTYAFDVTPSTPFLLIQGWGKAIQIRVDCTTAGTFYRNGAHMARIAIDGSAA